MKFERSIYKFLNFLAPSVLVMAQHSNISSESSLTSGSAFEASTTNNSRSGTTAKGGSSLSANVDQRQAWKDLEKNEKAIASKMMVFWSLSNKEAPPTQLLSDVGYTENKFEDLRQSLGSKIYLASAEKKILRQPFVDSQINSRIRSRRKIISLVEKIQEEAPDMRNYLPEMLTVWGEARGIRGFTEEDDTLQQAKMASIIHVLRNRTQKRIDLLRKRGETALDYVEKWKIATTRFQFSAFEPYDPNLSLIGLGPLKSEKSWTFDTLPRNDQRALINLARVMARLEAGGIQIPDPLGQKNTRHYLTPTLIKYNRKQEKMMKQAWSQNPRFNVLRIPSVAPEFLAIVPNWALQRKLIGDARVVMKNSGSTPPTEVKIPPKDFVYFGGIL